MKPNLDKEIGGVLVTVSIFPPDGYQNVEMSLLNETMLILSEEFGDLIEEADGPCHRDSYAILVYKDLDAASAAPDDAEKIRARAVELYENCAARKALVEAYAAPYDELDQRGCDIENGKHTPAEGEYKEISDEMERIQDLIDARSPYEFGDKRDLVDVLASVDV